MPTEQLIKKLPEAPTPGLDSQLLPEKPVPAPGRLLANFTTQLVILLAAIYVLFWCFYPWRPLAEVDIPAWMVKFASDTAQMVRDSQAPIITLGTSLIGAPVGRLKRPNLYQEVLSSSAGKSLPTDLLSSPGAVMSDQAFVVHELFAHHKKPALIILTYSSRDFMDNEVADRIAITPTRRVISFINKIQSFFPGEMSWNAFSDCLSNHTLFADLLRRHWLRSLAIAACKNTGHPMTLWDGARWTKSKNDPAAQTPPSEAIADNATEEQKQAAERATILKLDLELYNRRYNPYNDRRTNTQLKYLQDLLAECQGHGVQVLVIGMPVSPANNKLLKPGVYEALDAKIRTIAAGNKASIIDINTMPGVKFKQDDFTDSVHLTKEGSLRFLPIFSRCVFSSPSFSKAFPKANH